MVVRNSSLRDCLQGFFAICRSVYWDLISVLDGLIESDSLQLEALIRADDLVEAVHQLERQVQEDMAQSVPDVWFPMYRSGTINEFISFQNRSFLKAMIIYPFWKNNTSSFHEVSFHRVPHKDHQWMLTEIHGHDFFWYQIDTEKRSVYRTDVQGECILLVQAGKWVSSKRKEDLKRFNATSQRIRLLLSETRIHRPRTTTLTKP